MKKAFQKLHLIVGLLIGLVVFTVATTGCIVAFEEELRGFFYSDLLSVMETGKERISLDEVKNVILTSNPNQEIKAILVKNEPDASIEVQLQNREAHYVNPYSGTYLGKINKRNDFFGTVLRLHRNLLLDEPGEWITGISALLFLFMIVSGIIIWWPRSKRSRKEKFTFKLNVHPIKRNYDLHAVLGFYASWFILFTVLTALIWSFEWAEKSMFALTNSQKERRMEVESVSENKNQIFSLDGILSKVKIPNTARTIINFPKDKKDAYRIMTRYENPGFFNRQEQYFFDQYSGELLKNKPFDSNSLGMKLRISNERIHTGQSFGLVGRWLVFFASLICASLPITGFFIWRNKAKGN